MSEQQIQAAQKLKVRLAAKKTNRLAMEAKQKAAPPPQSGADNVDGQGAPALQLAAPQSNVSVPVVAVQTDDDKIKELTKKWGTFTNIPTIQKLMLHPDPDKSFFINDINIDPIDTNNITDNNLKNAVNLYNSLEKNLKTKKPYEISKKYLTSLDNSIQSINPIATNTKKVETSTDTTNEGNFFTRFATGLTGKTKNLFTKTSQPIKEDTLHIKPIDGDTYKIVNAGDKDFDTAYTLKRPGLGSCYAVVPKSVTNQDQTGTGALTGNDAAVDSSSIEIEEKEMGGGKTRKRRHTKRRPNRRKNGFKSRARRN